MNEKLLVIQEPNLQEIHIQETCCSETSCGGTSAADSHAEPTSCCGLSPSLRLGTEEATDLASMFKALGHPVRLQIVALLSRYGGEVCVCDIEEQFDLSQPTISHHLKTLRKTGLIDCEQRGLWVYYYTRPEAVDALRNLTGTLSPA